MSRRLKARDKVTQKMSRDGLVLRNETTGADKLVSKRNAEFDLQGNLQVDATYSQVGNRSGGKSGKRKKHSARQSSDVKPNEPQNDGFPHKQKHKSAKVKVQSDSGQLTDTVNTQTRQVISNPQDNPTIDIPDIPPKQLDGCSKLNVQENTAFQHESKTSAITHESPKSESVLNHKTTVTDKLKTYVQNVPLNSPKQPLDKRKIRTKRNSSLRQNEPVQKNRTAHITARAA